MVEFQISDRLEPIATPRFSATPQTYGTKFEFAVLGAAPAGLPSPGHTATTSEWRILSFGPARWLLLHSMPGQPAPTGLPEGRFTDVSHATTEFVCEGPQLSAIFAKATPLDPRPGHFDAGQCARTWFAGFPVLIEHRGADCRLFIEAPLAAALRAWLADAV